jgi:hypothetical protein
LQPVAETYAGAGRPRSICDARAAMEGKFGDAIRAGGGA